MWQLKRIFLVFILCLFSAHAFSSVMPYLHAGHFTMLGQAGPSSLHVGNSRLGITSIETDQLVEKSNPTPLTGSLGLGYWIPLHLSPTCNFMWFPSLEPELNVYYFKGHSTGAGLRFLSPDFNQISYKLPVQSTRVMADAVLTLLSLREISLFMVGGLGPSWNNVGYSDRSKPGFDLEGIKLETRTQTKLASEIGAGFRFAIVPHINLSFEYLYTYFGKLKTASHGNTGDIPEVQIKPASFRLSSQAFLLGVQLELPS